MSELVTCTHCGATNLPGARWCGQCFGSLAADPSGGVPTAHTTLAQPSPTKSGWECRACSHVNDIETSVCAACGSSIYSSYGADSAQAVTDPESALRRAIIFPGFGYGSLNLGGIGVVAGFLAIASAVVGTMLVIVGELVGLVLIGAFLAIWAISVVDVVRLAQGEPIPLLQPRVLSVVGGIVVMLLLVTVLLAFQSATA